MVLTLGDRPRRLLSALGSIRTRDPRARIVVVHNGGRVPPAADLPSAVTSIRLEHNVGVPAGRDVGVRELGDVDVVFFLDDDAMCRSSGIPDRVLDAMAADPGLAAVALRIVDEHGSTMRRHVPRFGAGSASRSGPVTYFLGGACALRRSAYLAVGGYGGVFRFGHEELDLAWRLLDAGYSLAYDAESVVTHPSNPVTAATPARWYHLGRNRVLLARRQLPTPLQYVHALGWLVVGLGRASTSTQRRSYLRGWVRGWCREVERRPVAWSTVARMVALGRPPVL